MMQKITDERELTETYRLRYKVYVEEWGFEKPENYPKGIETDEYDKNSVHFAARDDTGELIGTIRLIVNPPGEFPIERYCQIELRDNEIPRGNLAEISRLAISKNYRKRTEDKYVYGPDEERRSIGSFNFYTKKIHYRRFDDKYKHNIFKKKNHQQALRARPEAVINSTS
jgi:N-acyl amino acid synthase of PEP-CTERM/exosortase system